MAGLVVLVGIVGYALIRQPTATPTPSAAPAAQPAAQPASQAEGNGSGVMATVPDALSPEARIISERYRCICGCDDPLSTCTCANTPGSRDMKAHLQELVASGKSSRDIDQGMIDKYGAQVLLSESPDESP